MGVWERRDGERIMENGRPQREMAVVESGEGATARQNRPNPPARPAGNSSQTAGRGRLGKSARPPGEACAMPQPAKRRGLGVWGRSDALRYSGGKFALRALSTAGRIRGIQRGGTG